MKDASHTTRSGVSGTILDVRLRAFVRSSTTTFSSLRRFNASSPYPTSTEYTLAAPFASSTWVKPPVEHPTSTATFPMALRPKPLNSSSACAIFMPPRDTHGCGFWPLRRTLSVILTLVAPLWTGLSLTRTLLVMHMAAASRTSVAMPSRTITSASRCLPLMLGGGFSQSCVAPSVILYPAASSSAGRRTTFGPFSGGVSAFHHGGSEGRKARPRWGVRLACPARCSICTISSVEQTCRRILPASAADPPLDPPDV
mmetsp:Transcript_21115/g.41036  ORF Transcript_21115/g.41036 Transcript_21115/m.41036 type:complete len:256 (+) Transcript_21115:366-1133(+)